MHKSTIDLLRCITCGGSLICENMSIESEDPNEIQAGTLVCRNCSAHFLIKGGIPRFVPSENYADNFGVQWNMFRRTQLDSHSGQPISRDRFVRYTGWTKQDLTGARVLDAGCGAGRFAEVALSLGARVIAIDFSTAIDAARDNLKGANIDFIQADIACLPFAPGSFDHVYCLGVIQHTPNPSVTFAKLAEVVKAGGRLALDSYPKSWKNLFMAYYWIRPITRRMSTKRSLGWVRRLFPAMYAVSRVVSRIPLVGYHLRYLIPVSNYTRVLPLSDAQLREWALLDTFDQWAPAYDQPQTMQAIRTWFEEGGFSNIEIFHSGIFVGRGTKSVAAGPGPVTASG